MSNLGLNATIYRATKKYADLLDLYLIERKSKQQSPSTELERNVKEFFSQLKKVDILELQIQLIASILERDCRERGINMSNLIDRIIKGLERNSREASFVKELEGIASTLSNETSTVLSRMRGYSQ